MGARISTGTNNKQDYATPADFMAAVAKRFGPIAFDLAAHAGNARSPNYFAPVTGPEGPLPHDPKAFGMDSFDHSWSDLSCNRFRSEGRKGLLWLNCEFNDIPRWTKRVMEESGKGANILSLTPASVGSVWFDTLVASYANVYLLRPRISFIPGEPYNKDCMLAHFVSPSDEERRIDRDPGFPFTIERWRKCCSIRDGISALGKILSELLGKEDDSAAKLDSIQPRLQLSLSGLMEEEKIQGGKKQ